jgi:hypothetical protein
MHRLGARQALNFWAESQLPPRWPGEAASQPSLVG